MRTRLSTIFYCLCFFSIGISAQGVLTGTQLLDKCISFHDPKGNWPRLHQKFYFHAKEPQDTAIYEELFLDNRVSFFGHISRPDGKLIEKGILDTVYFSRINGDTSMTQEDRKKYRLSKRAIASARNSYVFLYGLPMKLKDKGVKVYPDVKIDTFNNKKYYVLKADFERGKGNDTYYIFIDQKTFAMEGYKFNHNRKPNDGEFIICKGLINAQGIKIPQYRTWYSNESNEYIATDIVERVEKFKWNKKFPFRLK
jgi:hypothetical protein